MKQYTHAWIAFKVVERLEKAPIPDANKEYANALVRWFKAHRDGVINGAWYPDEIIKDNANSHVLKFTPDAQGESTLGMMPKGMGLYKARRKSPLYEKGYTVDSKDNLPERCEALAHSVIDNLRIQAREPKGSPVASTDNHIALILFMLSHYVADAHMPLHCDSRQFSEPFDLHGEIEGVWEKEVKNCFDIDSSNERFFYNRDGYPAFKNEPSYGNSLLKRAEDELGGRPFTIGWRSGNDTEGGNVLEYMHTICQYSYLLSYAFIPQNYDEMNMNLGNWRALAGQQLSFEDMSTIALSDAIDSVARVWFRVWRRYIQWRDKKK